MGIIAFLILAAVIGIPIYLRWEKRIEAEEQAMRKRRAAEAERRYAEEQRQKKLEKAVQEAEDRARKEAEAGGYGEYFDLLQYLRKTHQPEYKIDWLLKSLKMGRKLDNGGEYVYESMKENLPYFCETAGEYSFFHEMPASIMEGWVTDIVKVMTVAYNETSGYMSHTDKFLFWMDALQKMAAQGNREAQAALCTETGYSFLTEEQLAQNKARYEQRLREDAAAGDPYAQLAVGRWLSGRYWSPQAQSFYEKAAAQGLTDACYWMAEAVAFPYDENSQQRPQEELEAAKPVAWAYYLRGAEYNRGLTAAHCQWYVAYHYEDGKGVPVDYKLALYWYQKAAENGHPYADRDVEKVKRKLLQVSG